METALSQISFVYVGTVLTAGCATLKRSSIPLILVLLGKESALPCIPEVLLSSVLAAVSGVGAVLWSRTVGN